MPNVFTRPVSHSNLKPLLNSCSKGLSYFDYMHIDQILSEQQLEQRERQSMRSETVAIMDSIDLSHDEHMRLDEILRKSLSTHYCPCCSGEINKGSCGECGWLG